jgi:hypothetical protein
MTRFYIDEREISPPPEISSLNQILAHFQDAEIPPNSIVRMISINGIPILKEDLSQNNVEINRKVSCSEKVEIVTGTVEEIVRDSIAEALEYLDRVEAITPSLASCFQTNPGPEAFESLRQLYEGFYWLNLLLDKLATNFKIILSDIIVQGVPAQDHHLKFIEILKHLVDSQERKDMILISDLLEYEIIPMVPVWKELFEIISNEVGITQ